MSHHMQGGGGVRVSKRVIGLVLVGLILGACCLARMNDREARWEKAPSPTSEVTR